MLFVLFVSFVVNLSQASSVYSANWLTAFLDRMNKIDRNNTELTSFRSSCSSCKSCLLPFGLTAKKGE